MIFFEDCDLIIGNKLENDSDEQYHTCELCYRYDVCSRYIKKKRPETNQQE